MLLTSALPLHLNLSMCFFLNWQCKGLYSALKFCTEFLVTLTAFSTRNKATVHNMSGGTTEEKVNTSKWLLFAYLLCL